MLESVLEFITSIDPKTLAEMTSIDERMKELAEYCKRVSEEYAKQTGRSRKVTGITLGYESRCARPQAFDVMLGSQLGVGAYRALVEKRLDGVMVSISGQLDLNYVPFNQLVDPETLVTVVRYIEPGSDFHRLARFLETYVND